MVRMQIFGHGAKSPIREVHSDRTVGSFRPRRCKSAASLVFHDHLKHLLSQGALVVTGALLRGIKFYGGVVK